MKCRAAAGGIVFYRRWNSSTYRYVGYRIVVIPGYAVFLYYFDNIDDASASGTALAGPTGQVGVTGRTWRSATNNEDTVLDDFVLER